MRKASDLCGRTLPNGANSVKTAKPRSSGVIEKPREGEYPAYAHMYIDLLPDDGLILKHLADNCKATKEFFVSIPKDRLLYRYAEGKWTIKEILAHLVDDERIYVYRALRFARNDSTELPGFNQDQYARYSEANQRDSRDLLDEFSMVRRSTIAFFRSLDEKALGRTGVADGPSVCWRGGRVPSGSRVANGKCLELDRIPSTYTYITLCSPAGRRSLMFVGMHERINGHAGSIRVPDHFFTYAKCHEDVCFARKDEIARMGAGSP